MRHTPPKDSSLKDLSESYLMSNHRHLDQILSTWKFDPQGLSVRLAKGMNGRDVIQMRIDLGILQLETTGRPDGESVDGHPSFLDAMLAKELNDPEFVLDESECFEADREFVQFYHRRICWLRLNHYRQAVNDADHTLALMDLCRDHSPDDEWTDSHEHYRVFVLFHRTQAVALAELDESGAEAAISAINNGLETIREIFVEFESGEEFEEDEMVVRLSALRESLREEYAVGKTVHERLADAVNAEKYELAAQLRDQIARGDVKS